MDPTNVETVAVEVRPFKHQVGGHTCVLQVGRSTVCKPYMEKEAWFYENVPEDLKLFIPKYLGETYVSCDISQKRKSLVAMISRDLATKDSLIGPGKRCRGNDSEVSVKRRRKSQGNSNKEASENPECWSDICVDRQIRRYGFWTNNQPQKFILLENLVNNYRRPCMMDLKMGRRQYGEDSDDAKRKLLESRCAETTSATLGFRICGSKTFKATSDSYTFHDKYFGRHLNDREAGNEIREFFHNGAILRRDVIQKIVTKLEMLQDVLMSQTALFFHSASLLLLYDGATSLCSDPFHEPDDKYSIRQKFRTHIDQSDNSLHDFSSCKSEIEVSKTNDVNSLSVLKEGSVYNVNDVRNVTSVKECTDDVEKSTHPTGRVTDRCDVRLIDFAHVSENQTNVGDSSIIFGLKTLKHILEKILEGTPT